EMFALLASRWSFFLDLLWQNIALSGIAILLITLIGIVLGIVITYHKLAAQMVLGLVNFLYTIPSIALFGILVSFSGIGTTTALIALVIYGLVPIIRNTYVGIMEVDPGIIEAAKGLGTSPWQLLYKIQLPLAMPYIIAGFKTITVMTIALTGIASFIGAGGLGVGIWRGITTYNTAMTALSSILVALLALSADLCISWIEHFVTKKVS
ncbi:MAG: ABC transporter permease, partial [Erysipelotrichaceae bacterium]